MITDPDSARIKAQMKFYWAIWAGNLTTLVGLYVFLGALGSPPASGLVNLPLNLVGFVPLFVSIVIRWLVLPRTTRPGSVFVLFVLGLAMGEGCGILGLFLGGPYRDSLFVLGVLGVTQYVPIFVRQLLEPKSSGFIPNN